MRILWPYVLALAVIIGLLIWAAGLSMAQAPCGPAKTMLEGLAKGNFAEVPMLQGPVTGTGQLMRIFANGTTRTWTIGLLSPDGKTLCFVAAGYGLEHERVIAAGKAM